MATETAPTTNGVYNGYQAQDTSSVTSGANHSATASQSAAASTSGNKPEALEIGWYFVEQYYTTLSKNPERIHLFYSKKSQMITGKEAEKVLPSVGQKVRSQFCYHRYMTDRSAKAISEKIKELQLQDCKVRVLNVDSQASFQNIVVQVIGEMSNNSNPHEKFAQTFVLAEQPNGYFVLNDIFRYLDMGEEEPAEEQPTDEEPEGQASVVPEAHIESKKSGESVADKAGADVLDAKLEEVAQDEEKAEPTVETDEPETSGDETEEQPVELPTKTEEAPAQPAIDPEKPPAPEPSRAQSPHKEAAPSPATEAAPVKKTWASMVGAKAAAAPAVPTQPAAPQTSVPKSAQAPATATPPSGETPPSSTTAQGNGWQTADHSKKQNRTQPKTDQVVLAYVKGVTEKVDARVLRETLATFGELKYFDVSRPKVSVLR